MPNIKSVKKDVERSRAAYEKNKANKTALKYRYEEVRGRCCFRQPRAG